MFNYYVTNKKDWSNNILFEKQISSFLYLWRSNSTPDNFFRRGHFETSRQSITASKMWKFNMRGAGKLIHQLILHIIICFVKKKKKKSKRKKKKIKLRARTLCVPKLTLQKVF